MSRRYRLALAVAASAVLCALVVAPAAGESPPSGEHEYRILRNGSPIGTHRVKIRSRGGRLAIRHRIDIRVTVVGWDAYRYRLQSAEFWTGDRLTRLTAHTNKNGTPLSVRASLRGSQLVVSGAEQARAPPEAVPASPAWNVLERQPRKMIDAESGELWNVRVSEGESATLRLAGREIDTRRYRVRGDLEATLWYGPQGLLVKKRLSAPDGSTVESVLR